jgi:putative oxidoreductase
MIRTDSIVLWAPRVLSIIRIMVGLLFLEHGTQKMLNFPPGTHPALFTLSWFQGVIELVGGLLLTIGLFTRPVAFILSGDMAFAYFMGHMFKAGLGAPVYTPLLNGGNAAILFCFACLYFVFAGGGAWSVDAVLRKRV